MFVPLHQAIDFTASLATIICWVDGLGYLWQGANLIGFRTLLLAKRTVVIQNQVRGPLGPEVKKGAKDAEHYYYKAGAGTQADRCETELSAAARV